jgi:hypothetical protein
MSWNNLIKIQIKKKNKYFIIKKKNNKKIINNPKIIPFKK